MAWRACLVACQHMEAQKAAVKAGSCMGTD